MSRLFDKSLEKEAGCLTGKPAGKAAGKVAAGKLSGIFSGKALTVARHEFLKTIRRKEFLFITFVFPLLFILIAIGPAFFASLAPAESQTIAYIDLSGSLDFSLDAAGEGLKTGPLEIGGSEDSAGKAAEDSAEITAGDAAKKAAEASAEDLQHLELIMDDDLYPTPGIRFIRYEGVEEARQALEAGELSSYLVIPEDFLESGFVELYSIEKGEFFSGLELSEQLSDIIVISLLKDRVDEPVLRRVKEPVRIRVFNLGGNGEAEEQGLSTILSDFGLPFITSFLLFLSIFSASGYLLRGIAEEKENRIIEVLLSSLSPLELLAGKILGLGAVGLLQIMIWGSAVGLGATYTFPLGVDPFLFLLAFVYFLLGYLIFSSLMAGVGAMTSSLQESQQVAGIFTFAAASPLVFIQLLLTNPNSPIPVFLSLFPFTSSVAMMARLAATDVPFYQIVASLLILVVSIYWVVLFSSRLFRASLLMYGKKLKLREIWGYIKAG